MRVEASLPPVLPQFNSLTIIVPEEFSSMFISVFHFTTHKFISELLEELFLGVFSSLGTDVEKVGGWCLLSLDSPKAEPETRIWDQVVYLEAL